MTFSTQKSTDARSYLKSYNKDTIFASDELRMLITVTLFKLAYLFFLVKLYLWDKIIKNY